MTNKRRVIYVPPSKNCIKSFARDVCSRLADDRDPGLNDPEIVNGLADFLEVIARIEAKRLSDPEEPLGEFDNDAAWR
jgi:hypothetical protein